MADYLCRVRIDRAALDENLLLVEEGAIETERFYLKLTDEEVKEGFSTIEEFNTFLYSGTNIDSLKVQALLDAMKASNTLADTEVIDSTDPATLGYACPLCSNIRKEAGKSVIYLTDDESLVSDNLLFVHDHIKVCGECKNYYCNGGKEVQDVTPDGNVIYPETFLEHEKQFGHKPEDVQGIKQPKIVTMEEIIGKSLLRQFSMYCLKLDEKEDYDLETGYFSSLNSYLKIYPTNTSYLSYKYEVGENNGKCTLRIKAEVAPCDYFLNREYVNIEELSERVSIFLSYTIIPEEPEIPEDTQPEEELENGELIIEGASFEDGELIAENIDIEF